MKILIIGAGAVGTYFGAALAMAGHQVTFGVRDASKSSIDREGLLLTGPRGEFPVRGVSHTSDPRTAIDMDIVLSTVKLYDAASSARQWRVSLESSGVAICLQNGVDGVERMLMSAPDSTAIGGIAFVSGSSNSSGKVKYLSDMSSLTVGTTTIEKNATLKAFVESFANAPNPLNVRIEQTEDIRLAQWQKFLALATNAALTCLVRLGAGAIYHDPTLIELARRSIREIFDVGRAEGVPLSYADKEFAVEMLQGLPADMVASMHHDLLSGRRLELDGLSGHICRRGRVHNIPTPFHDFAYGCLKPHMDGGSTGLF
ncbi:2-dehydropantoate 2-reductase [Caballeronia sp. ATUFL_M2_KS44]|uniref:ketopantoate reductase family protein n=1 Tax=Caballeronia sp. ATUFL_M2_KS44 TaxID=2921767 RepID=UPI0020290CF8|nr:2-dehydropantoate 2-reductase [Caballeronia sp. ATUFL_M2_KS44]